MDSVGTKRSKHNDPLFRWAATTTLVAAAASAGAFALLDASTIASRLSGATITSRPMWWHTFSVAALTCFVAAYALRAGPTRHEVTTRLAALFAAVANISVPVLAMSHDDISVIVPAVHCVLAGLLTMMAVLAGR